MRFFNKHFWIIGALTSTGRFAFTCSWSTSLWLLHLVRHRKRDFFFFEVFKNRAILWFERSLLPAKFNVAAVFVTAFLSRALNLIVQIFYLDIALQFSAVWLCQFLVWIELANWIDFYWRAEWVLAEFGWICEWQGLVILRSACQNKRSILSRPDLSLINVILRLSTLNWWDFSDFVLISGRYKPFIASTCKDIASHALINLILWSFESRGILDCSEPLHVVRINLSEVLTNVNSLITREIWSQLRVSLRRDCVHH